MLKTTVNMVYALMTITVTIQCSKVSHGHDELETQNKGLHSRKTIAINYTSTHLPPNPLPRLLRPLPLLPLHPPHLPQIRRRLNPQLPPQLPHIPLQQLLPINTNQLLGPEPIPNRPRQVRGPKPPPLPALQPRDGKQTQPGHGQPRVRELEPLERHLPLHDDGQIRQRVVEIVAFPVPLHHVRQFFVVHVAYARARVRGHAFAVEPGCVGGAEGVGGQGPQLGERERGGCYAWAGAEDAASRWGGEEGCA